MKSSHQNKNQQTNSPVQFIYGKKLVKNTYHYALKQLGQPISQISWQSLTSFKKESNYLIRYFETTYSYLFYNQKISKSQNGIRVHIKTSFCQVYIPKINYSRNQQIQDQKWKLQNISNQIFSTQFIRNQQIKDVEIAIKDSKLEQNDVVVQITHLPPFLGEQYSKQKIISTQSFTNFQQIINKDRQIDGDIKLLMSFEKSQKMKSNEIQKMQQIEFQNEQTAQEDQIIQHNQIFNQINNKLSKKNTKKTDSNEKNNSLIRQQQLKIKRKIDLQKRIINKKYLNKSFDLQKKKKSNSSYDEIMSIENDSKSLKIEIQSLHEDFDKKQEVFHLDTNSQKQLNQNSKKNSHSFLRQSQINNKNQIQKKVNGRAVKTANFLSVQNINHQTLIQSMNDNNCNNDKNKNEINTIKFDDIQYQSNEITNNYKTNNTTNKLKIIIKNNNSSLQNNEIKMQLNQTNNYLQEKKIEKEDLQDQIVNEKKKENEDLKEMIFKEAQQQTKKNKNQQMQQEIYKLHFDSMSQIKPSRCSISIIPKLKDAQIQVYVIETNESDRIQYDSDLNRVIIPTMIIVTIKSHLLMNEHLFFQCLYINGKEYFVEYDELKSYNPLELLDYMIYNSILI
ncbi:unnamed protein product [Paramecium sonneborni]|uniref:Uncharacterized protein n=1 Tax=Paramecium sonneborni TaxID=65129 RepID=A0A8S1PHD2_9CILI|nr:unnamed protein product [Paramecium sonneborni]